MARLSAFRSRLVQTIGISVACLLQMVAGIMSVPADLAPQGTLLGWLIAYERSWVPWLVIGVNAGLMYGMLIGYKSIWGILGAIGLCLLHGTSYATVFCATNLYPPEGVAQVWFFGESVVVFAGMYGVLVGVLWLTHFFFRIICGIATR